MDIYSWLSLGLICFLGAASPGPSLLVIFKITNQLGKVAGIFSSLGHGLGIFIYAFAAATGIAFLSQKSQILFIIIQFMGALFLIWLALNIIFSKTQPNVIESDFSSSNLIHSFNKGLLIALLNPKVAIFFGSIFSGFVNSKQTIPLHFQMASLAGFIDVIVYVVYVLFLSSKQVRKNLNQHKNLLNNFLALIFLVIGSFIAFQVFKLFL